MSNDRGHTVSIIPTGGGSPRLVDVGKDPTELSSAFGSIWVVNAGSDSVARLNDPTGALEALIPVGGGPTSIQPGDPFLWVANTDDGTVVRINSAAKVAGPPISVGSQPTGVTNDREGGMWVRNTGDHTISRIDQGSLEVRTLDVPGTPIAMAVTSGTLWVVTDDGSLLRIDIDKLRVRTHRPRAHPRLDRLRAPIRGSPQPAGHLGRERRRHRPAYRRVAGTGGSIGCRSRP